MVFYFIVVVYLYDFFSGSYFFIFSVVHKIYAVLYTYMRFKCDVAIHKQKKKKRRKISKEKKKIYESHSIMGVLSNVVVM